MASNAKANGNPTLGDVVLVRWIDSCSPTMGRWLGKTGMAEWGPVECVSVGRIGRKDDEALVVCASWSPDEFGDVTAIPTVCIKSIEVLQRMDPL